MRLLRFSLIPLVLVIIAGCGSSGKDGPTISTAPALSEATRIAITSFIAGDKTGILGKRIPLNLATRLELALKDVEWIYDQSDKVNPVAAKLQELGLTLEDIFADSALAAKVGKELKADLIIVGRIDNPKFTDKDYSTLLKRQGRQAGISGTATYIRKRLSALVKTRIKVIDTKTGDLVFNDSVRDYLKYWYAFQTQQRRQIVFKTEENMMADLGNHLPRRIAYVLYPTGLPEVKEGEVLLKPEIELLGNQGVITFD